MALPADEVDGLVEIRIHLRAVNHDILREDVSGTRSCSRSAINPGPTGSHARFFRVWGVIRAFDARTGALAWAWDLGNPEITGQPLEGQTYTRGTPNMWTTASYGDQLGLIYAPLGNATPDFFGMGRPPHSDEYNSSLVALDVVTGRVKWKFQTVHHDIWDYDLPSQPALVNVPDGKGGTIPAVLQTTKRGQLFLFDRATGKPIADVAEKPVPTTGAVPEEKLSSMQPYSVGMPTYAGTMTTAGGLVFFAGFQDYYIRAYDAQNGKLVWQYALPVGSSATPISYVSPVTGKQYVVISVGGAAHSPDNGDYVMAFSLPDTHN
jgi:glucose dehydrogenase